MYGLKLLNRKSLVTTKKRSNFTKEEDFLFNMELLSTCLVQLRESAFIIKEIMFYVT